MIYNLKFHLKPAHLEPFIYWFHGIIRWWFLIFLYLAESDYPVPVCQNLSWVTILAVVSLGGLMIETVRYEAEWGKIKPDWGRGEIWDMPNIITMDWWAAIHHTGWEVINPLTPIILHHTGRTEPRTLHSVVSCVLNTAINSWVPLHPLPALGDTIKSLLLYFLLPSAGETGCKHGQEGELVSDLSTSIKTVHNIDYLEYIVWWVSKFTKAGIYCIKDEVKRTSKVQFKVR